MPYLARILTVEGVSWGDRWMAGDLRVYIEFAIAPKLVDLMKLPDDAPIVPVRVRAVLERILEPEDGGLLAIYRLPAFTRN